MATVLTPSDLELRSDLLDLVGIDGFQHRAVRARALVDGQSQMTRHQRRRRIGEHLVGRDADVAPELDDVAETRGAQEGRLGALALDYGIGDERRCVGKPLASSIVDPWAEWPSSVRPASIARAGSSGVVSRFAV